MNDITALLDLLGEQNVERLRGRIVDIICDRIQSDLEAYGQYIFYPPDYEEFFDDCFQTAMKKVKKQITEKMMNQMLEAEANIEKRSEKNKKIP